MSKFQKKTLILLLAVVALLAAALAIVLAENRRQAQEAEEAQAAADAANTITNDSAWSALTYSNGETALSFALDESGKWTWADDPEFPLDDTTVVGMLDILSALKPQQTITDGDTLDAYGLDEPTATITATDPQGQTLTLDFGKTTTDGASYYVLMNGEESPVYIIDGTIRNNMDKPIYDMCDLPELPDLNGDNVQTLTLKGAETVTLTPRGSGGDVTWHAGGEDVTADETVSNAITQLGQLSIAKCVDFKPTDQAASICGFDAPAATVTVDYESETGTDQTLTLTFGAAGLDEGSRYVRVDGGSTIYQMNESGVDALLALAETGLAA